MDFTIRNNFPVNATARDIIVFQDSTKMAVILHPEQGERFTLTDIDDYLTINVNAHPGNKPFDKDFKITYPVDMADHLVYSLGKEDIQVEYKEAENMGILSFSAGVPEWQVLISGSISGNDEEESMPDVGPNTTVTIGEATL